MFWGWYPAELENLLANWNPDARYNKKAFKDLQAGEQPSIEDRMEYSPPGDMAATYEVSKCTEWTYTPIPYNIRKFSSGKSPWLPPTPTPVEDVIQVITECYALVTKAGGMPEAMEPIDMTDEMVERVMVVLNEQLDYEYRPWGGGARFDHAPQFPLDTMSVKDKRTVVAHIQKALHKARGRF